MWDLFGIARFIARIIQDENHEIETDSTASDTDESNVDDEEAENIRTVRALLEFEAKSLELNLGGHDDLEQPATAVAIGNLKKYCEERFSEVNSRNISAVSGPHELHLEGALQSAVEDGRFPYAQDLLGLKSSQEYQIAVEQFTAVNTRIESASRSWTDSVTVGTETTKHGVIRQRLRCLYTQLGNEFSRNESSHQHQAMLQLSGFEERQNGIAAPSFELFLSHCLPSTIWHETHCTMTEEEASPDNPPSEPICCTILKYYNLRRALHFSFNQACLWISPKSRGLKWDLAVPCVSLRELLDNGAFFDGDKTCTYTQTEKYLLVLNLARCFFYLYDGPWGPCDWTADRIFFLHKPGADEIDGRLTPYVCCHLPNGVRNGALEVARDEVCPPVLLSFARLLLEIERGEVLPTTSANSPKNKDLHKQLSHMVEHELEYKLAGPYQKAIEGCLYFDADLMTARGATKDIQARHVILHNIVENLRQQYYFYLWEAPPPENTALRLASVTLETERQTWKPSTLSGSGLTDKVPSLHQNPRAPSETFMQDINNRSSLRSTTYASAFILFDDMYESSENDSETRKAFVENMEKFQRQYIFPSSSFSTGPGPLPHVREDRIRIAVLDTGILGDDILIRAAKDRIRGYWNPEHLGQARATDCKDSYGHGTHVVRILLKIAPFADVFIAKISENKTLEESKVHLIADAINWATAECKADIITMSFGLDNRSRAVTEAIASAVEEDRIIFAAASNSGGNSGRAYPASLPGVMCVHATDGYGNQALFNPSKEKGDDNFATLGVAIDSRWENKTVLKSGTSFATPVAAGIAANVLQFAKNHELVKYERLCCFRGMRRMFKYMSSERGDYEYVSPWKVFRPQDDGQMQSHTKKICDNIRTLLSTDKIPEM